MSLISRIRNSLQQRRREASQEERLVPFKTLCRWLWQTWRGFRLQALLNTLIGLVLVLTDLAFVWATKHAVDIATGATKGASLKWALILIAAIILVQVGLGLANRWIRATLGVKARCVMQKRLFTRLLESRWMDMKKFHTGDILNRIDNDLGTVIGFLTESIPAMFNTVVQFIGAFVFLLLMNKQLAMLIIIIVPLFIIFSRLFVRKLRQLSHHIRSIESTLQSIIQESLQHTLVIKTLERTPNTIDKLDRTQKQMRTKVVEKTVYTSVSAGLMNVGFGVGYLVAFGWGVWNLQQGAITYGALIAFIQLVSQIQRPVRQITGYVPVFISAFTASERLIQLEQIPLEEKMPDNRLEGTSSIEISNLTYAYTPTSRKIFRQANYSFPEGSITAILGNTGSGKTTLIRLLLALISPDEGTITLRDAHGNAFPVSSGTRCNFSYVPQGNTLISGTIRSNLLMGKPDATDAEMLEALHLAAANFVASLPQGLDTPCQEMGGGLSEGQAQRIAIARAMLKPAPFLLLDEATSALDSETEKRVIQNIIEKYRGRTIVVVTHRPEVLKYCTQTFTIEKLKKDE